VSDIISQWPQIKTLFNQALDSSMHIAIASVNDEGEPHVTPIGSMTLGAPGRGYYFEAFTSGMPKNFRNNPAVCVLAVNSSKWFWFRSLLKGQFIQPPGIRLRGTAGPVRAATKQEIERWQRRVRAARRLKGHAQLWAGMAKVRDIEFTSIEPIRIGQMTQQTPGMIE